RPDSKVRDIQTERLKSVRSSRDGKKVQEAMAKLKEAAQDNANIFPALFAAVEARTSVGEITATLKQVFGEYHEPQTV
ncbi:MAG: methylmalonyl-CoA mutase family protein, partial [Deltaproteobacteria bacterium]|nr:methylmalonyl-CoA mutase family protein [Deltaproteobacteria bacterium]